MIERLVGECIKKHASGVIIDVNGIGYGVELTLVTGSRIHEGDRLVLWIYTHMNEDSTRLFGFLTYEERQMFALLLGVNRLGPKIALTMMGTFSLVQIIEMIDQENSVMLAQVPGIGLQSAKKFLLELKPKLDRSSMKPKLWEARPFEQHEQGASDSNQKLKSILFDIKSALQNLGYKEREILPVIQNIESECKGAQSQESINFESLLRLAINRITRNHKTQDKTEINLF